jgi:queuine/archaeosine tRNA-ribosyltransferase
MKKGKSQNLASTKTRPHIWLGQSADTSSICSSYDELRTAAFLTSLGCVMRRPGLRGSHFNSTLRDKLGLAGPLMIDSGGFALMKAPSTKWSVTIVGNFIESIDAEVFVSLDLPPTAGDDQDVRRRKIRASIRNFRYLLDRFPTKTIMPVVHGRSIGEINYSIELLLRTLRNPSWVGLGGIVPLLQNRYTSSEVAMLGSEAFIGLSIMAVRNAFPHAKIHAFGAGGTRTFPAVFALGADSADSIGWRQAAGFGSIFLPMKSQRVVVWPRDMKPPRKMLDESDLEQIASCACPICRSRASTSSRLAAFAKGFHNRAIHNAWTVCNQFRSWPRNRSAMISLLANGIFGPKWASALRS